MGDARAMAEEEAAQAAQPAARRGGPFEGAIALAPAAVAGLVANPGTEHVLKAQAMLESLPESFRRAARQPGQATALFVALAIDTAPEARERQLAFIHQQYGGEHHDAVKAMLPQVDALTAVQRMPALLQVFAALSQLGRAERVELLKCLNGLLVRENRASPFAYALRKLAQVQLQDNLDPRRRAAGHLSAQGARDSLQVLFSALATQGSEDEAAARQAYEAGMALMLPGIHPPYARLAHWPPQLDQALTRIDRLQPAAKEPAGAGARRHHLPRWPHDRRRVRAPARDLRDRALPAAAALRHGATKGTFTLVTMGGRFDQVNVPFGRCLSATGRGSGRTV